MLSIEPCPTEDEAAAILSAIAIQLADEANRQIGPKWDDWHWSASGAMMTQGLRPVRAIHQPSWSSVERLRRAGQGGMGIVGL